jgi:thiol:disulfide interchange protein DsbD
MWSKLRMSLLAPLAAAVFASVLFFPDLIASGQTVGASDLGLGGLLARGSWLAIAAAFAGGLLTALTPCVYPLIPITVSIFGARRADTRLHAMVLSALYVLGIAVTYSALGVGAALTGQAFGTVMSNPWVVAAVSAVLAAMAASMFGAFDLTLPSGLHRRLSAFGGTGMAGSFGMGLVAGVIAAPCTGPVLAAALTVIAQKGSVAYGLGVMFPYALGLGLPFFLIGAFSLSFPKGGPWMETVKSVFGVALLAAAAIFARDAFPALKPLFSAAKGAAMVAAAVAAVGVLFGALDRSFRGAAKERLLKGAGIALLVGGIVYATGAADARARKVSALAWLHDEPAAIALARAEGRPLLIDFWAEWCVACKELDKFVWSDPRVQARAARFVALKLDGTGDSPAFQALVAKYAVAGMPTVVFVDTQGRESPARVVGAVDAAEMLKYLEATEVACDAQPLVACSTRW